MKTLLALIATVFSITANAQDIKRITIPSDAFDQPREVWVYTPEGYKEETSRRYEVVYVFDAQARFYFDITHATINFLNNFYYPMIVVGIISEERNKDFLPKNEHEATYKKYHGYLGNADKMTVFMGQDVVPYIDDNYRTLPTRIAIGHSNGGTFLSYCLLEKPLLFDAYITISPNFAYDDEQIIKRLEKFDPAKLGSEKYFYMCNADEKEEWITARKKAAALFNSEKFERNLHFINEDFSASKNHMSVFPTGLTNGLSRYFEYQFFNVENVVNYYQNLDKKGFHPTSDQINMLAYSFYWEGKTKEAIKVMTWALERFPEDHNLYDSMGEFQNNTGNKEKAKEYYLQALKVLEKQKSKLEEDVYNKKYQTYKGNYDSVK